VQLFDTPESVGEAVASFLADGVGSGDTLLVVARGVHTQAITTALANRDIPLQPLIDSGRLTILDAVATLRQLSLNGMPDAARFDRVVGDLVRHLSADGARLRIYGEMVDVLAEQLEFGSALKLERLWAELLETTPVALLCGYASAHFTPTSAAGRLREVCSCHDRVVQGQSDVLGSWVLAQHAALN